MSALVEFMQKTNLVEFFFSPELTRIQIRVACSFIDSTLGTIIMSALSELNVCLGIWFQSPELIGVTERNPITESPLIVGLDLFHPLL